jgi:hypothetical protein
MSSEELERRSTQSDEYRGSLLEILTIALAGVSLVLVVVRGIARHRIARVFEATDILLPIALVCSFLGCEA